MEKSIKLNSNEEAIALYGSLDENLRYAEETFRVRISARNHKLKISGDKQNVDKACRYFAAELKKLREGGGHHPGHSRAENPAAHERRSHIHHSNYEGHIKFFHRGKVLSAQSKNQEEYLAAIRDHDIVIGVGPAGTGKTYLAMAAAIDALKKKIVSRIVLTRPAVEAGENLGFLPGDLQAKVNPYLRPLYDALYDMVDFEEAARYVERGTIEVAPLAYMRGRTLNDSFVILDEGQNTTQSQMKMFLTRLGMSSKAVITGDVTQVDLPNGKKSGLLEASEILANVKGISIVRFNETDVVRHPLVQAIITAYDKLASKP